MRTPLISRTHKDWVTSVKLRCLRLALRFERAQNTCTAPYLRDDKAEIVPRPSTDPALAVSFPRSSGDK